jgi:hypothetical protein
MFYTSACGTSLEEHAALTPALCHFQGFTGITNADAGVRSALLDFSFNLAVGRHEEAFRAVAALRSPAVWQAMAHMAIKSKRLDVAGMLTRKHDHTYSRGTSTFMHTGDFAEVRCLPLSVLRLTCIV